MPVEHKVGYLLFELDPMYLGRGTATKASRKVRCLKSDDTLRMVAGARCGISVRLAPVIRFACVLYVRSCINVMCLFAYLSVLAMA